MNFSKVVNFQMKVIVRKNLNKFTSIFFSKNSKNNNIIKKESSKGLKIAKNTYGKIINKKSNKINIKENQSYKKSKSSFIDRSSSDSEEHSNDNSNKHKNSKI